MGKDSDTAYKVFANIVKCLSSYYPMVKGGTVEQLAKRASFTTLDMFRRKGMTQEQMGERLGMTSTQVYRVIRYHETNRAKRKENKCTKSAEVNSQS